MVANWPSWFANLVHTGSLIPRGTLALSAESSQHGAGCLCMLALDGGRADEWVRGERGDRADRKGMTVVARLSFTARGAHVCWYASSLSQLCRLSLKKVPDEKEFHSSSFLLRLPLPSPPLFPPAPDRRADPLPPVSTQV
ncbi:unnamed protein product [Pleuronectes platessa]|uniref:Uncharacterized protein n=1 Tax=Pleuronectes platessa TaxID=8262 RepID=A0A9N7V6T2_PLEPL|nr:unnamed protein product [Pleuronectes platessa]